MYSRMKRFAIGAFALIISLETFALPMVFTDRTLWESAAGSITTEDFNGMALGPVSPATVFASGITLDTDSSVREFGFVDIGEGNSLDGTNQTIILPGNIYAFGFDYVDVDLVGVDIGFGAFTDALPLTGDADAEVTPDDFGFYGVVLGSPGELPGGAFSFSGEGFTIDNISFSSEASAVPAPATIALMGLGLIGIAWKRRKRA